MSKSIFDKKLSPILSDLLPEFVRADHQQFIKFLRDYFKYLEAGELEISGSVNYLKQETLSDNLVLDENGDNIVLQDSVSKFTVGETITGSTSKATAQVLVDDFDDNQKLYITSNQRFITGETITGASSLSSATITKYRANPVQNIQQLLEYANVDNTIFDFLDKFRDSFLEGIPNTLANGLSKRKLIKSIKDLYSAKGTEKGHKLFFRMLFDDEAELFYPRDNMLRVSESTWSENSFMRVIENTGSNFTELENQTITGQSSGASILIEKVTKFTESGTQFAQLQVSLDSLNGTFTIGETISGASSISDVSMSGTVQELLTGANITSGGQYYEINDTVTVSGGNGQGQLIVKDIGTGSIDEIVIDDVGSGYIVGDSVVFNNSGTNGGGASAEVEIVGGAISLENKTSPDLVQTEEREQIVVHHSVSFDLEDATNNNAYITLNTEADDNDNIILEDDSGLLLSELSAVDFARQQSQPTDLSGEVILESDVIDFSEDAFTFDSSATTFDTGLGNDSSFKLIQEQFEILDLRLEQTVGTTDNILYEDDTLIQLEPNTLTSGERGSIRKIKVLQKGAGYNSLPTITVSSSTGSNAAIISKSTSGVGAITQFAVQNFGSSYTSSDTITLRKNVLVKDITDTYNTDENIDEFTGQIKSIDTTQQIIELSGTNVPEKGDTITGASSTASSTVEQCESATATVLTGAVGTSVADFQNASGKLSEDSMRIQDSYYYQDYSYVVKIGNSIADWRDSIKKATHPAGFQVFGQVTFSSLVSAVIQTPAAGSVSGFTGDTETFTPELASTFRTLFSRVFGRRLGTATDGTTLNANALSGFDANTDGGGTVLPSGKREVTLTSSVSVNLSGTRGASTTGPFLKNLNLYGFMKEGFISDDENIHAYYTIDQFSDITLSDAANPFTTASLTTRINVPPRGEIRISKTGMFQTFDMDFRTFDDIRQTFDEDSAGSITIDTLGQDFLDFSEESRTFDSSSTTFDIGFAGLTNPLDFSQTLYKFDDTLGGDYARFDADFSFSQTANITTTFDASAFRFDATLSDMGLTFDNTAT
tara:strand:+ start:625 stop:3789 length:3165 start_codon:yes stop_codon:yes gene_type:complete